MALCAAVSDPEAHVSCRELKRIYGGGPGGCDDGEHRSSSAVDTALRGAACSATPGAHAAACGALRAEASSRQPAAWTAAVAEEATVMGAC